MRDGCSVAGRAVCHTFAVRLAVRRSRFTPMSRPIPLDARPPRQARSCRRPTTGVCLPEREVEAVDPLYSHRSTRFHRWICASTWLISGSMKTHVWSVVIDPSRVEAVGRECSGAVPLFILKNLNSSSGTLWGVITHTRLLPLRPLSGACSMRSRMRRLIAGFAFCLALATPFLTLRGPRPPLARLSVSGAITDISGGVLTVSTVDAIVAGRVVATAMSGEQGGYELAVPSGVPFQLSVTREGFAGQVVDVAGTSVSVSARHRAPDWHACRTRWWSRRREDSRTARA